MSRFPRALQDGSSARQPGHRPAMALIALLCTAGCRLKSDETPPCPACDPRDSSAGDVDGDGFESVAAGGQDCDDTDPAVHPDAAEVPYDGIDQDCSGADLTDVDGDGYDGVVDGAADCDDSDPAIHPGAVETANDGVDQDCDGADLVVTDVDGDGHDAASAGGDDCDDATSTTFPGAAEDEANGVDDDCDGLVDERMVCWDGSGDVLTIQEGVDAAPDGGVVEICPGTYAEVVSVIDRDLTIQGGGDLPDEVVVDAGEGGGAFYLEGDALNLTVRNLAIRGGDRNPGVVSSGSLHSVTFDLIDFCTGTADTSLYIYGGYGGGDQTISRSYFCPEDDVQITVSAGGAGSIFQFAENVIMASPKAALSLSTPGGEGSRAEVRNNLFIGGVVYIDLPYGEGGVQTVNNTFAQGEIVTFSVGNVATGEWGAWNNIVDEMTDASGHTLDLQYTVGTDWVPETPDCSALAPAPAGPNLMWRDQNGAGLCKVWNSYGDSAEAENLDSMLASMFFTADPMFVSSPGMGEYALDPASPAVDVAIGDPDADGSPPDLGAFGGPDGDWWTEVPWLD